MDEDPWDRLNSGYAHDGIAQFELILDGVEEAARRLQAPAVSDQRLALIVVDYIADVLLGRHIERIVEISQRGGASEPRERFDEKARNLLRQRFNRRVSLSANPYETLAAAAFGLGQPILDAEGAEVLRVAHAYRNDIYHEDHYNAEALPIITAHALHTVVGAWMAMHRPGWASSQGARGPLMDRLRERGYNPDPTGMLSLHTAATTIRDWLQTEVAVELAEHRRLLAEDVVTRVGWVESMIEWLAGWQGPGQEQIEPALHWNEFWQTHGDDPELLGLDNERAEALATLTATAEPSPEAQATAASADTAYMSCFQSKYAAFRPKLALTDLPSLTRRGQALQQVGKAGPLLARYRTLDMEIRVFEETFAEMARQWDQHVQQQEDLRRGK